MSLHQNPSRADRRYLSVSLLALLASSTGLAQEAQPAAAQPAAPTVGEEEVVVLSPFIVDASKDQGYYAENTLAGSRLNTKISDLGPSISVITKQLLEDTASVDVNDIFRYEINTEGSLTYTPGVQSLRNDGIADVNSGVAIGGTVGQTNATANRVRGLGSPTAAINYYPAVSQVPMDAYNVSSLEINRGPNSMLFGMGSPAGIVNQSWATAVLTRDFGQAVARFDSNGSYRGSVSFNKALIKDRLAIYGAALSDNKRFERKPSYDNSKRYYGAISIKPFEGTTIRASVESYKNDNRRPNSLSPRDYVTMWNNAGQPMYDSVSRKVTLADGTVKGVYVPNASSPYAQSVRDFIMTLPGYSASKWGGAPTGQTVSPTNATTYNGVAIFGDPAMTNTSSAMYVPGMFYVNKSRSVQQIVDGELLNWFQPLLEQSYRTTWGTAANPAANAPTYPTASQIWANPTWADMYNRGFTSLGGFGVPATIATNQYKYSAVTDKAIYDWSDVNINQMNFGSDKQMTYNIELEQKILDNLYLNAGWFRQNFRSESQFTVAQLNVATLFVDTNKYLPNGQANPMAGKVYVEDQDPDYTISKQDHDHYRVMLAYTPDFTKNDNWTKWFGRHQLLGMVSGQESMTGLIRRRMLYVDSATTAGKYRYLPNPNNNADGSATGWSFGTAGHRRQFYLAGQSDANGVVTQSAGEWNVRDYTGDITVYDYASSSFQTTNVTERYIDIEPSTGRNQRKLKSLSAGMTNYLWDDRIITTFGVREDTNRTRSTTTGQILSGYKGTVVEASLTNPQKWVNGVFQTDLINDRWQYWDELSGTTRTLGGVFKPFKNWTSIERNAKGGSIAWQFLRDFGVSYNKSNNFDAPATTQVDAFGTPLPKPQGEGQDYGFQFSLFDNKFFARVTWFEGTNENERTNPGTSISRLTGNVDTTLFRNWARTIALINMGKDPTGPAAEFVAAAGAETAALEAAAAKIWQLPYNYYNDIGGISATRNAEAKGVELQLNYNPVPNWTMRLTAGKQTTIYTNVLKEFDAWFAVRNPVWSAAKASDYLLPQYQHLATYTTEGGRAVDLTNFWTSYGYDTNIRLDQPDGYYNAQLYYNGVVTPQVLVARDLNGQAAPGQRRYRWSYMTNYVFQTGRMKGFSVGGGQRWEDKAVIGYLGKASGANGTLLDVSDTTKPVYDSANWYTDLWISYSRKIFADKVNMKIQLNVDNVFESGSLRVTAVNYDGSPYAYRIIDSRLFKLTTTFDF